MRGPIVTIGVMGAVYWVAMAMAMVIAGAFIGAIAAVIVLVRIIMFLRDTWNQADTPRHRFDMLAVPIGSVVVTVSILLLPQVNDWATAVCGWAVRGDNGVILIWLILVPSILLSVISVYLLRSKNRSTRLLTYIMIPVAFLATGFLFLSAHKSDQWVEVWDDFYVEQTPELGRRHTVTFIIEPVKEPGGYAGPASIYHPSYVNTSLKDEAVLPWKETRSITGLDLKYRPEQVYVGAQPGAGFTDSLFNEKGYDKIACIIKVDGKVVTHLVMVADDVDAFSCHPYE